MSVFPNRWKHVPTAASTLVVCGLLAAGAVYTLNYWERDAYLTSRNFRLLAVLAKQTEAAIDSHAHARASRLGIPPSQLTHVLRIGEGRSAIALRRDRKTDVDTTGVGQIVTLVFAPKIDQGAFDTLALATTAGHVAFAVGRREWELNSTNLAALLPEPQTLAAASQSIASSESPSSAFTRISVLDASVAGVPYKMFIQPCCQLVTQDPGSTDGQNVTSPAGAIVVGLVASDALADEAMAISPTLVVVASLLVVLAFLVWPFLSVALPGPRKRITEWDALQLGFSGTVGLGIATILAVTSVQCRHLEDDLEVQLETLAKGLDEELTREIADSSKALTAFEDWLSTCPTVKQPLGYVVEKACKAVDGGTQAKPPKYRNYTVAALVGADGRQVRKAWSTQGTPPPLVDVSDRQYFRTALAYSRAQPLKAALTAADFACTGPPCVLQSLVSYTTGEPSAVLARPSRHDVLPVAAITLPMRSVINPALPPGFEFAVIERTGRVVFHSDVQRNTFEDLFLETDRNRQLRSLIATGVDGPVRTEYWGRPYLAYVKHAGVYGWSVVTLFDRRNLRGLMLEWTMVSLLLLGAYTLLWAGAISFAVVTGASWLWPDRFRARRYVLLSVVYVLLIGAFGAAFVSPPSMMAVAGFALPSVACAVTYLVLRRRPAARVGVARLDYRYGYCTAGALLMIITGVVPGAAFVARSYDAHIEAYVKHRQLGIVQALLARPPFDPAPDTSTPESKQSEASISVPMLEGWHGRFLYGTSLCREHDRPRSPASSEERLPASANLASRLEACPPPTPPAQVEADAALDPADQSWQLERHLPYFSEMSVQIRELVRSRADDGSWTSERSDLRTILRVPQGRAGQQELIKATTELPPLASARMGGATPAILLGLVALAYGVAFFIAHYVFLGKVSAPMWALGRLGIPEGRTIILVCDPPSMAPRIVSGEELQLGPLLANANPEAALAERLEQIERDGAADRPLVVIDLDAANPDARRVTDRTRFLAALTRTRRHAVLALTPPPVPEWSNALESAADADPEAMTEMQKAVKDLKDAGAMVLDWTAHPTAAAGPLVLSSVPGLGGWWRRAALRGRPTAAGHKPRRMRPDGEALLQSEERAHPSLRPICDSIRRLDAFRMSRLTRSELLEEIDERAEALYSEIWTSCGDIEKLELRHIAQFGLANPGNSRAVRKLITSRLVTKDPNLRVMNRTFQRFVVSPQSGGQLAQTDVARIEGELGASVWDQFRAPFALAVIGVAAFLFLTQRETYNTTVGAVVGLATQVPNILKTLTMMVYKDNSAPMGQRNV